MHIPRKKHTCKSVFPFFLLLLQLLFWQVIGLSPILTVFSTMRDHKNFAVKSSSSPFLFFLVIVGLGSQQEIACQTVALIGEEGKGL